MYKQSGESVDHLLLHCFMARELWSMVFGLFGVHWMMPCHVLHLWDNWQVRCGNSQTMVVWRMIPHCVMCASGGRGMLDILKIERSVLDLKLLFFQTLYDWVSSLGLFSIHSMVELIDHCRF